MDKKHFYLILAFVFVIVFIFVLPELAPRALDNLILMHGKKDDVLIEAAQQDVGCQSVKYLFKLDIFLELFSKIAGAVSLLGLLYQFGRERSVNQAEFILNINNNFITNPDLMKIYKKLEKSKSDDQSVNPFTEDDIIDMANYLAFFESFYNLIHQKVIRISAVDQLAYRFFLATNNKFMQEMLLCKEGKDIAWKDLYKLHELWKKYRIKNDGYTVWQQENELSNYVNYKSILAS